MLNWMNFFPLSLLFFRDKPGNEKKFSSHPVTHTHSYCCCFFFGEGVNNERKNTFRRLEGESVNFDFTQRLMVVCDEKATFTLCEGYWEWNNFFLTLSTVVALSEIKLIWKFFINLSKFPCKQTSESIRSEIFFDLNFNLFSFLISHQQKALISIRQKGDQALQLLSIQNVHCRERKSLEWKFSPRNEVSSSSF